MKARPLFLIVLLICASIIMMHQAAAQAIMPRTSAFGRFNGIQTPISDLWAGAIVTHTIDLNASDPTLTRKPLCYLLGHQWRTGVRSVEKRLHHALLKRLFGQRAKGVNQPSKHIFKT